MEKPFHILDVSRNDLEMLGFDASNLSDNDMKAVAEKLTDGLIEYFGQELEYLATDVFDIPRLKWQNN